MPQAGHFGIYEASAKLTPRQLRTFRMLADGMSYRDIARAECITHTAVQQRVVTLCKKLGCSGLADLRKKSIEPKGIQFLLKMIEDRLSKIEDILRLVMVADAGVSKKMRESSIEELGALQRRELS